MKLCLSPGRCYVVFLEGKFCLRAKIDHLNGSYPSYCSMLGHHRFPSSILTGCPSSRPMLIQRRQEEHRTVKTPARWKRYCENKLYCIPLKQLNAPSQSSNLVSELIGKTFSHALQLHLLDKAPLSLAVLF